jgi:phosphoribosyl 1,2-cyclic phosphodiesterase
MASEICGASSGVTFLNTLCNTSTSTLKQNRWVVQVTLVVESCNWNVIFSKTYNFFHKEHSKAESSDTATR